MCCINVTSHMSLISCESSLVVLEVFFQWQTISCDYRPTSYSIRCDDIWNAMRSIIGELFNTIYAIWIALIEQSKYATTALHQRWQNVHAVGPTLNQRSLSAKAANTIRDSVVCADRRQYIITQCQYLPSRRRAFWIILDQLVTDTRQAL